MDLSKANPSGHDYSVRPNYFDLSFDHNDKPCQNDTAIIVTSWWGHLHFLKATLGQYIKSEAFVLCAYDNPMMPWSRELEFKSRMPTYDIWQIPDQWVFKHTAYDNDKRNGWLWLMNYAQGIVRQFANFKYIIHVNGDCIWENPEGLQDLKDELGDDDLMSISSQENNIHTCAVIYKVKAFHFIMDFIRKYLSPPIIGSWSPEELLTLAVRSNEMNERIAPIQPMELDGSSVDHYSRYDQSSTWKNLVGYKNLGAIFLTCLIERREPPKLEYVDIHKMKLVCKGYSDSLFNYYETKDRRYLYQAFDHNEDSWYDRVYMPIEYYGGKPVYEKGADNIFEKIMKACEAIPG
jgi:hypothetical protein